MPAPATPLYSHNKYWAECFGTAPQLPMSRAEMDALGWDSCDIIIVTGDAYVDHPSFGMAIIGRLLEAHGFRVGIIAQPDWHSKDGVRAARQAESVFRRRGRQHGLDDQPLHGGQESAGTTMPTRRAASAASAPTAVRSCTRSAARKLTRMCRWYSAASKPRCGASRISTTGRAACDARSCSTPAPTSWSTATPSAPSSSCRIASRAASTSRDITDVRGTAFMRQDTPDGLVGNRFDAHRSARPHRSDRQPLREYAGKRSLRDDNRSEGPVERRQRVALRPRRATQSRAYGDPPAVVREGAQRCGAVCACQSRAASRNQSG